MTYTEFITFAKSIERQRASDPASVVKLMRSWTWTGLLGMALLLSLPVLMIGGYIAWITFVCTPLSEVPGTIPAITLMGMCVMSLMILGSILPALQLKRQTPPGLEILPHEAPALFKELEAIRAQTGAAPFDAVLLSADCNACVTSGPRPGVKGKRRYLVLGVPLLTALSPEAMRAVLAHEFSHRESLWLTHNAERVELWLRKLVPDTGIRCRARGPLDVPLTWFAPRFRAVKLAFCRAHEITADADAARFASAPAMADALKRLAVLTRLQAGWLESLIRSSWKETEPPGNLCERWQQAVVNCPAEKASEWLQRALIEPTFKHRTHPCLRERLRALGCEEDADSQPAPPVQTSAFTAWCADAAPAVQRKFDLWWSGALSQWWASARGTLMNAHALLDTEPANDEKATAAERAERAWQRAWAVMQCRSAKEAEPFVAEILKIDPAHPQALEWDITRRLDEGDVSAQALIPTHPQIAAHEKMWLNASVAHAFKGDHEAELAALHQADLAADKAGSAPAAGSGPRSLAGAVLTPHDLTTEQIAVIVERASVQPCIQAVSIACRKAAPPAAQSRPVIAVRVNSTGREPAGQSFYLARNTILEAVKAAKLRHEFDLHICLPKDFTLAPAMFCIPQTIIYDRRTAIR